MRGQEEPPLMLPVPHDVKIPDTRPGWGHGPGAHSQDLAMSDPAPAQVLATDWVIRNKNKNWNNKHYSPREIDL